MKRILLAGAAALALAAQPTLAADAPVYKGPPPPASALFNWSGFYVGLHAGYAWAGVSGIYDQLDAAGPTNLGALKLDGFVLGGQIGWNWQVNNFVVGVEADASWAHARDSMLGSEPVGSGRGPDTITVRRDYLASIRARLGVTWDRLLIYGTAGLGFTRHSISIADVFTATTGTRSVSKSGLVVGAGIEHAFSNNMTWRLEYLHYAVGTRFALTSPPFADADPGDFVRFGPVNVVRAGVNVRF